MEKFGHVFSFMPEIIEKFGYKKIEGSENYPFDDIHGKTYNIWGKRIFTDIFEFKFFRDKFYRKNNFIYKDTKTVGSFVNGSTMKICTIYIMTI